MKTSDLVLVEHPSIPAKNLAELLALGPAKPGTLNFGSSGPGSNYHMAAELDLVAENIAAHQACLWVGFMAPAHTPQPIIDLLNHTIAAILHARTSKLPGKKAAWEKQGATPLVMSRAEFENFMAAEVVK